MRETRFLTLSIGHGLAVFLSAALLSTLADAQAAAPQTSPPAADPQVTSGAASPRSLDDLLSAEPATVPDAGIAPLSLPAGPATLSAGDREALGQALASARRGDGPGAQAALAQIGDPTARKLTFWAAVDVDGEQLGFFQLDQARRDLAGWPRAGRRQAAAEKTIEIAGLGPQQIVDWFQAAEPQSPQGAMALAGAYERLGRRKDAEALIRRWWRTKVFEADAQRAMLARFADLLTQDDHIARVDALLYGQQGPAARDMTPLLPADQQALAEARMALRAESGDANALVANLPASLAASPGLAVERARYLLKHNLEDLALGLVDDFPANPPNDDAAVRIWGERKLLINSALRAGKFPVAYAAAANNGLTSGPEYAEAEFYAGWIALSKLHDPALADTHFARIEAVGSSPITQARALYWRGRAAEARGDAVAAKAFYTHGARFYTAFYGQLAAEKAGMAQITLGQDPIVSAADRKRFEGREAVRAARMLAEVGQRDLFRAFVLFVADTLTEPQDAAQIVDMARDYGDQDLAMRAVRTAAQHGFILPERGYPLRAAPAGGADPAIVFGVIRQESGFDPHVRSGVGARGMMQLMPTTAKVVARRMGERFSPALLDDADYNMRLGSAYIDGMISDFGGSYLMATAAYNAGPGRPADWAGFCGDPRASGVDPVDFIECIPFSETRNYVMRVLEGAQIYRARLHGGAAPITLAEDLKRGGYVYSRVSLPPPLPAPTAVSYPAAASQDDPIGRLLEQ
jgi:soluble lytic murein transglycosylase